MATNLQVKSKPVETLADFWDAANIPEAPAWARKLKLGKFPFQHQIGDLNHLAQSARSGLWNDPGLGKTFPAQAHILWLTSLGNKAICVMPPVLVQQFGKSFHQNFPGIGAHVQIEVFVGDVEARNRQIDHWNRAGWPQILVMSNDLFAGKSKKELDSLIRKRVKAGAKKGISAEAAGITSEADTANVELWLKKGYNHVLLDEATSVKSPSSDLHKAIKQFVGKDDETSNGLTLMTGSPIENTLDDAYGLIALLTPDRYGSWRAFERIHCVLTYAFKYPKTIGYQNHEFLWQSLYLKGRRVTKKDALDLPPRMVTEFQIELAKPHMDLYKRLLHFRMLEIGDRVIDATTAGSLYQKTQRMLLCPEHFQEDEWKTENRLLTALDELVHSLGGRKLLLFAWYTESIQKLAQRYEKLNPTLLYGEVTGTMREEAKKRFIEDPKCKLMICNPRSGGVGVDGLQMVCSHVAFIEPIGIPGLFEQAISRLHRTGQKEESINIYMFTALRTVAVKLRNDLVRKEAAANSVVRDSKTMLRDLMGDEGIVGSLE